MSEEGKGAGFVNIWYMLRYRAIHRIIFAAIATGLGISVADGPDGNLVLEMSKTIRGGTCSPGAFIFKKASPESSPN
jgi:hypothetical protein